ncbi:MULTISPECIES: SDR family oxidoreductase [unclassified Streptomyces]|uniref:SDR family oxidoreductase n=1 Tax=unclassified Streptomyces TaxID=2593676 RepID=UPI00190C4851|nr:MULTISPECIES: SDR family oxidoreductase [unclassified Streptomyces]MBK3569933.1 SDR family oxidoreductase [Streptomyces sp. MBT62]MBK6016245.1 SDR family oxidoreductase [Streptomyces sp. MBT53]
MPDRTWLITGTSTGIGRALAETVLERGDRVAATVRTPGALAPLAGTAGDRLLPLTLDMTDPAGITRAVERTRDAFGRIDVVVSNAGYGLFGAAEEVTEEQIERQLGTNLLGPIRLARAVLPQLRAQGGGRFVQISSVGGLTTLPHLSLYHASKWGVEGFFEALRSEVEPFGVQVTLVEPGTVRTDFAGRSGDSAAPLEAYAGTPAAVIRQVIEQGAVPAAGDPGKVARAVADLADLERAPLRLVLGSDAFALVQDALRRRLGSLEEQKDIALSTDADLPA